MLSFSFVLFPASSFCCLTATWNAPVDVSTRSPFGSPFSLGVPSLCLFTHSSNEASESSHVSPLSLQVRSAMHHSTTAPSAFCVKTCSPSFSTRTRTIPVLSPRTVPTTLPSPVSLSSLLLLLLLCAHFPRTSAATTLSEKVCSANGSGFSSSPSSSSLPFSFSSSLPFFSLLLLLLLFVSVVFKGFLIVNSSLSHLPPPLPFSSFSLSLPSSSSSFASSSSSSLSSFLLRTFLFFVLCVLFSSNA